MTSTAREQLVALQAERERLASELSDLEEAGAVDLETAGVDELVAAMRSQRLLAERGPALRTVIFRLDRQIAAIMTALKDAARRERLHHERVQIGTESEQLLAIVDELLADLDVRLAGIGRTSGNGKLAITCIDFRKNVVDFRREFVNLL